MKKTDKHLLALSTPNDSNALERSRDLSEDWSQRLRVAGYAVEVLPDVEADFTGDNDNGRRAQMLSSARAQLDRASALVIAHSDSEGRINIGHSVVTHVREALRLKMPVLLQPLETEEPG